MYLGNFVFLKDKYFEDFPDNNILKNKVTSNGKTSRPFFFVFEEKNNMMWIVPISSQVDKYKAHYNKSMEKYGKCDTILFGNVLGKERAFLLQNMCPITEEYIDQIYTVNDFPVRLEQNFEKNLISISKFVLNKHRSLVEQGRTGLIFPDVLTIEKKLLKAQQSSWKALDPPLRCWPHEDGSMIKDNTIKVKVSSGESLQGRKILLLPLSEIHLKKEEDFMKVIELSPSIIEKINKLHPNLKLNFKGPSMSFKQKM